MHLLYRRLYNGGFNHLKSTKSLLRKAPRVIRLQSFTRPCSVSSVKLSTEPEIKSPTIGGDHAVRNPSQLSNEPHMSAHKDFVQANEAYVADFGDKGTLPIPPAKKLMIITCMDARINVFGALGLQEGEAHIVRNAGGSTRDALRSIIISQRLLGTREIAVFHHTGCGMQTFDTPGLRERVKASDPSNPALDAVDEIDFLEFPHLDQSVVDDVKFLEEHPLVLPGTKITGWVYEVETGRIRQMV